MVRVENEASNRRGFALARQRADADAANWIAWLGPDHNSRVERIEELFAERSATMWSSLVVDASWKTTIHAQIGPLVKDVHHTGYVYFMVSRSLASMDFRERTYLKLAEILNSVYEGREYFYRKCRTALIWGDGKGTEENSSYIVQGDAWSGGQSAVPWAVQQNQMTVNQIANQLQQQLRQILQRSDLHPTLREQLEPFASQTSPSGDVNWIRGSDIAKSPFVPQSDYAVHIGTLKDGTPLTYSGEGSVVTIAPPGSGKTACNVYPNLLSWPGPAVVLDISGDIYEHTAGWRAANVGPVFKFSPLEPEDSHKYNPLTFVRSDRDYLWEDSRLLAEMMVVPSLNASDPFWENEARTVLTAAIANACYLSEPDQRPMHDVLDVLFGGEPWDRMIDGLRTATDMHVMTQHANALSSMNEKTLSSVLQTARSSLTAWTGERVSRATARSDWNPLDLRDGSNPTVYIYMRPNEVEAYLSLLRVFIGQHIRTLTGGPVPPRGSPPILFMLDELPRLRTMPPVDEALNIGRKYGLRLWMFAQSVGQLKTAYENAEGMLGSCAVRIYMNPSGADGLAERISDELGYVESLQDNSRRRLVEPHDLAGPGFRDAQIVLATGSRPARVSKDFAFQNPEFARRMAMT
ncbi:type IV secretory system conjugative DNA transfer family protein [Mycobacterium heidelbergense]|uniref:type IV secretory system conjugative DNA transfer family protein n=1 Tax=Mycobacterium heidelbergense TaxID=53376 RepID=UPI003CF2AF48